MNNLQGKGTPTSQWPVTSLMPPLPTTMSSATTPSSSLSSSLSFPTLPLGLPSFQAMQVNAFLPPHGAGHTPPRRVNERKATLKRPHEPQDRSDSPDNKSDKKARAERSTHGMGQGSPDVGPLPDGVEALLRLMQQANAPSPPRLPPSLPVAPALPVATEVSRPQPPESKSSPETAPAQTHGDLFAAYKRAQDVASLAALPEPQYREEVKARQVVFNRFAKALKASSRPQGFSLAIQRIVEPTPSAHLLELVGLEARAMARHMSPQQRSEALATAKAAMSPHAPPCEPQRRRMQFLSLYPQMDPATLAMEAAAARREADLLDLDHDGLQAALSLRTQQFVVLASIHTAEQRATELARLRLTGRPIHLRGEALARALKLLYRQFWAALGCMTESQRRAELTTPLTLTQELQDMDDAAWRRTLDVRKQELMAHLDFMPPDSRLATLRQALDPAGLVALRGATLERGLALRQQLVSVWFAHLTQADRDRALAEAKAPQGLAEVASGPALDIAIRLRKLVFEAYFHTLGSTDGAAAIARAELAAALDTTGLASQPEPVMARTVLLQLNLVDAARQHLPPHNGSGLPESVLQGPAGTVRSTPEVPRQGLVTQSLMSSTSSPPSSHTTTTSVLGTSTLHTATGPVFLNGVAPSSSSTSSRGPFVMTTGMLLRK